MEGKFTSTQRTVTGNAARNLDGRGTWNEEGLGATFQKLGTGQK